MENYYKERASVRNFSDKEVDDSMLNEILTLAAKAPTTGNMQLYTVIKSRKSPARKALEELHFNQPAATGAPVLLTFCADFERFNRWCKLRNADAGFDNLLSFTSAMTDALLMAQQTVTIAEQRGLGTCYLGTVTYNADKIAKLLKLPKLTFPVACVAIGWPAVKGGATERLPLEAIVADEQYPDWSDDDILALFKDKEEYPANAGFPAENGKENLAQVFAEVRYPRGLNEEVSKMLEKHLKDSGWIK